MTDGGDDFRERAFLASADHLVTISDEAVRWGWSARLSPVTARGAVDRRNAHLIVPVERRAAQGVVPACYRCYAWYKLAGVDERAGVLLDVSESMLRRLRRPTEQQFDRLVLMLVEQLPTELPAE